MPGVLESGESLVLLQCMSAVMARRVSSLRCTSSVTIGGIADIPRGRGTPPQRGALAKWVVLQSSPLVSFYMWVSLSVSMPPIPN
jgi:hypothetical protein